MQDPHRRGIEWIAARESERATATARHRLTGHVFQRSRQTVALGRLHHTIGQARIIENRYPRSCYDTFLIETGQYREVRSLPSGQAVGRADDQVLTNFSIGDDRVPSGDDRAYAQSKKAARL